MASRIEITGLKEVIAALKNWNQQKQIGLQDIVRREIEPMLEGYAKANRPWKDRTGRARQGLTSSSERTASELVIRLAHTVPYGVFLELCQAGRFAILGPTMEATKAEMERILRKFWEE